ncbi:GIY-YIG nuclease family protein [Thermolongibacillus altinsuensis]
MINEQHTIYALFFDLHNSATIQIGKLGTFFFPKGHYIYVGSAKRNIRARIERHIKVEKKKRWHIDYLRPYGEITKIVTYSSELEECERAQQLMKEVNGKIIVNGFGSSDCGCPSHLIYYA